MSEKIATELGNWFLTLGFQDKNLSTDQIEAEFRRYVLQLLLSCCQDLRTKIVSYCRLSPPELRDTWRSIMMHVVPVKEARYIRKVLMLNELNKYKATRKKKILIGVHFWHFPTVFNKCIFTVVFRFIEKYQKRSRLRAIQELRWCIP